MTGSTSTLSTRLPLRIAMVGAGMISQKHLAAWREAEGADVVAIVEPDANRAAARAKEFGIARQYESFSALLAAETVDAIDVATPRETHGSLIEQAAARGIAVLCEKPLVPSVAEAARLLQALPKGSRVMVNQNFRFRPYYLAMKRWIDEGRLGSLTGCTIACRSSGLLLDPDGRYPYIERQPFVRHEQHLMIEEVLIHRIDVARWLCGPLRVVAARTRRSCPMLAGESEATLLLETIAGRIPVVIDGNFASAGYPAVSLDRVEIIGSRSRVTMDDHVLRLHGPDPEELRYEPGDASQHSFNRSIAHFVDCLRTGAPFLTDAGDNLNTLRLIEDAYFAAEQ